PIRSPRRARDARPAVDGVLHQVDPVARQARRPDRGPLPLQLDQLAPAEIAQLAPELRGRQGDARVAERQEDEGLADLGRAPCVQRLQDVPASHLASRLFEYFTHARSLVFALMVSRISSSLRSMATPKRIQSSRRT